MANGKSSVALADFAAHLQRHRMERGSPSIRTLVKLMARLGREYPRTTIDDKIAGRSLPDWQFVQAFVRACDQSYGSPDSDLTIWRDRHQQLLSRLAEARSEVRLALQAKSIIERSNAARRSPIVAIPTSRSADIPRPAIIEHLVSLLEKKASGVVAVTTALAGAGGFGKTTAARMLVHDSRLEALFPDGMLWVSLNENLTGPDLADRIDDACIPFTDVKPPYTDPLLAGAHLGKAIGDRRMLLIIDDVWYRSQLEPFIIGAPHAVRLVTTRRHSVLPSDAATLDVDAMTAIEARMLLLTGLGEVAESVVAPILGTTGRWPVLLALINGAARADMRGGATGAQALSEVHNELQASGITALDPSDADSREQAVSATVAVSLDRLDAVERGRFLELAVFPEDLEIPIEVVARFWAHTGGWAAPQTRVALRKLDDLSLLATYRGDPQGMVQLHDVIRKYLRDLLGGQLENFESALVYAHRQLVSRDGENRSAWWEAPAEQSYVWTWVPTHLKAAEMHEELRETVLHPAWIAGKLENVGAAALESDLLLVGNTVAAAIATGVRQNSHLLAPIPPPGSAAATLVSRLHSESVAEVMMRLRRSLPNPHLEAVAPLPDLPHPALLRVLVGHESSVVTLEMTPDASLVFSAGFDGQVRGWRIAEDDARGAFSYQGGRAGLLAVAPDGAWLASVEEEGSGSVLTVWDLATGTSRAAIRWSDDRIRVLAADPLGQWVAAAGEGGTVWLVDSAAAQVVREFHGHPAPVRAIAVDPGRDWLASASGDFSRLSDHHTICIWELSTGALRHRLSGHQAQIDVLAAARDGSWLASGGTDGKLLVWQPHSGELVAELLSGGRAIRALLIASDGSWLACADSDLAENSGSVTVWEGPPRGSIRWRSEGVPTAYALAESADHRSLMCGGGLYTGQTDHDIRIWDIASGQLREKFAGHGGPVRALLVAPNGAWVASASEDATVRFWSPPNVHPITINKEESTGISLLECSERGSWIACVKTTAVESREHRIHLRDIRSGAVLQTLSGTKKQILAMAASPDGSWLASAGFDDLITIWDTAAGRSLHVMPANSFWVQSLVAFPRSSRLLSGGDNGLVQVWDVPSGRSIMVLRGGNEPVRSLALPQHEEWFASAGGDTGGNSPTMVNVWDATTGQLIHMLQNPSTVSTLACAPDGSWLASAGSDGKIRLWDPLKGTLLHTLSGHQRHVATLQPASDGSWLASAAHDSVVQIWDPVSGRALHELAGHMRSVATLTLMSNGRLLASAGDDGSIRLWNPHTGKSVAAINVDGPLVALKSTEDFVHAGGPRGFYLMRLI